jgi:mono/diheme cytochrome c family protein
MRLTNIVWTSAIIAAAILLTAVISTANLKADGAGGAGPDTKAGKAAQVARGKYLVDIMGCHDCHTPMKLGPNGPEWDMTRALSGHPEQLVMPAAPVQQAPWLASMAMTMTAWNGPWGTSFTKNLTPDKETGLGDWTVEEFIATMKTGRERGKGRPVLPPMPVQNLKALSDSDIRALFAYLQSLPVIKNRTPQPIEPIEQK